MVKLRLYFKRKKVVYSSFPIIKGIPRFSIGGKLSLGKDVLINSGFSSNPVGSRNTTGIYVLEGGSIDIGDNVGLSNTLLHARKSIFIGDNVMIGGGTMIIDNDFHPLDYADRISKKNDKINCLPIFIKSGAFIGANSIIVKGVTIGNKSILAAGSVLTRDVPDFEIWGGNPARFIKKIHA